MKRSVIEAAPARRGLFASLGHGVRGRGWMAAGGGIAAALALVTAVAAEGCSTTTEAVPYGGECFVASDCAEGLVCITQPNGARACTDDLSGSTGDPPAAGGGVDGGGGEPDGAADDGGEVDGGEPADDAGGSSDAGGSPDAGRPDAGNDAGSDAGADAGDAGEP